MKRRFTLRLRLLLLTAVALLPAFIIVLVDQLSSRATRSAEADGFVARTAEVALGEVIRGMTGAATLMVAAGRAPTIVARDAQACEPYLAGIRSDLVTLLDVAVADADGHVYCHAGVSSQAALQASVSAMFSSPEQRGVTLGDFTATPAGPALPMGWAFATGDGPVTGFMYLNVNLSELTRLVSGVAQGFDSTAIVTDRNGTVLLTVPDGRATPGDPVSQDLAGFVHAAAPGTVHLNGPAGEPLVLAYRPVTATVPIAILFGVSEAQLMGPINRAAVTNSAIAVAGAGLVFLLAWLFGDAFIARPVAVLHRTLSARRAGNEQARTGLTDDGSEFGSIGTAVDGLFDELDRRHRLQREAEEQRDLHARDVQHRVKNLLAIVQVIARQTLSRADASAEVRAFESRISAIVRANTRLLAPDDRGGELAELVNDAIAPFAESGGDRVVVEGPPVVVRPKVGLALAMAFHELATNALKYGALSTPEGSVRVMWRCDDGRLELDWVERGGPAVAPPEKSGFGSVLISRVLEAETRGKVTTTFAPEGFSFRLAAPLEHVAAAG